MSVLVDEQTDPQLVEAVRRIARVCKPDFIYLFGSQVRGDATDDSDYDLLVVVPASDLPSYKHAQHDEKTRLTRGWLKSAEDDLQAVDRLVQPPELLGLAAYHCQQAVEKVLKGLLLWNDRPFRRTHNLVELVEQCTEIEVGFVRLRETAEALTPYGTESRYPDTELILDPYMLAEAQQMAV